MKRVGYLGPRGTFTERATRLLFPGEELLPFQTIPQAMDKAWANVVDYAVVPVENAIEGSVNLTLDYLIHKRRMPILASVTIDISHHLLVSEKNASKDFVPKKVLSHPQAVAQCHDFLQKTYPTIEIEYVSSTGAAAAWVEAHPEEQVCAIANQQAAETYHLHTAKENIHDYDYNRTRFVVLGNNSKAAEHITGPYHVGDKTTLMITLPSDFTGALHQVLSAFAWRKLNLSKIESRPTKTGLGNYFFVIDIEQRMDDVLVPGAMAELKALGCQVEVLGSYSSYSSQSVVETETSVNG
ncbi:prephenate dehydratase [Shouchella shacheensis]|uniref:prephenate dehydratase n=1 Tax=Shouchella shacheensis TaxID=1649580 RepID=UPI00073FD5C7|nr:prephenate dehydratase [Shouchella shacheensis]